MNSTSIRNGLLHPIGRRNRPPPHSDCPITETEDNLSINESSPPLEKQQRSISLTTLQQPRMAQLETLEAKMASIEVSLSNNTPRRRKNLNNGINNNNNINNINNNNNLLLRGLTTKDGKEFDCLRNVLRDKELMMKNLKGHLIIPGVQLKHQLKKKTKKNSNYYELTDNEKKQADERLNRLKSDIDNKRLIIKNLKIALEKLDITDNIDIRIQQAELEYQLGREELNLLTIFEEMRRLKLYLDESNRHSIEMNTLYNCIMDETQILMMGLEVEYDVKNPKFGAGQIDSKPGLFVDWALEETGLLKGDRLIEINGKMVLMQNHDDLQRLLAAAPDPAQIVILRRNPPNTPPTKETLATPTPSTILQTNNPCKQMQTLHLELEMVRKQAEEAQKNKMELKSDNIRLTHRISYLEEQVSELMGKKSTISTTKKNVTNININTPAIATDHMQLFQKGSQISTIIAGNSPGFIRGRPIVANDSHRSRPRKNTTTTIMDNTIDVNYKKATRIVDELTNTSAYERHRRGCMNGDNLDQSDLLKHYNGRKTHSVIDFRAKSYDHLNDRPKLLDYSSETGTDTRTRPQPPKKPIRLSLQKTHSLQSIETTNERTDLRSKCLKRNHKGETQLIDEFYARLNGFQPENGSWC